MGEAFVIGRDTRPGVLPAYPMPARIREHRPLSVFVCDVHIETLFGWIRIPKSYVTDFASIPWLATVATGMDLQALGPWAPAAIGHDWLYAIGEPGSRDKADAFFAWRMEIDGVPAVQRQILHAAVRLGGAGGYAQAARWWTSEGFADPVTGAYPIKPPFAREEAFAGAPWGLRPRPAWPSA